MPEERLDGWLAHRSPNYPADAWTRKGDTIVGHIEGNKYGRIISGDQNWESYEFSIKATLESGSNLQIVFRVSEGGHYMLDFLTGWQYVAISKKTKEPGVTKLDVANFKTEKGREYDITIAVQDQSITSYIDGVRINNLTDDSFSHGRVGFLMWHGAKVKSREPRIRVYERKRIKKDDHDHDHE